MIFLAISAIRRRPIRLCSSLCSSLPNLRPSVHLDGGFADHRLVNDSIAAIDLLRLLAYHRHRHAVLYYYTYSYYHPLLSLRERKLPGEFEYDA